MAEIEDWGGLFEELARAVGRLLPAGIAVLDVHGRYLYANDRLADAHGIPAEEHFLRTGEELGLASAADVRALVDRVAAAGDPLTGVELVLPSPKGDRMWSGSCHPLRLGASVLAVALVIEDRTDIERERERLERRAEQQSAIVGLGRAAVAGEPPHRLLDAACDVLCAALDVPMAAVLQVSRSAEVVVVSGRGFPDGFVGQVRSDPQGRSQAFVTLQAGTSMRTGDAAADDRFDTHPALLALGVRSAVTAIVPGDGGPWGVMAALDVERDRFGGDDVRLVEVVANIVGTALARFDQEAALRASEARRRLALEAGRMGTWEWDVATGRLSWDAVLEEIWGFEPGSFPGTMEAYVERIHPEDREATIAAIQRSMADRSDHFVEHRAVLPDGTVRWIDGRGAVIVGADGEITGMVGVSSDITARVTAEADARRARERVAFLSDAGDLLSRSLDLGETLGELTRLCVPQLADWCGIDLVDELGRPASLAAHHSDPEKLALALELRRRYPVDPDATFGVPNVVRTGLAEVRPVIGDEVLARIARDDEHLELIRSLGLRSLLIVPLTGTSGRAIGALTLVQGESGRRFSQEDVILAEALADRAAIAIEHARLFEERDRVARALQASLVPPSTPLIPNVPVEARYHPASRDAEIGGDFYDFHQTADDAWSVAIGDVQGKGADAAALTGVVRHTLRAVTMREASPSRALELLNEAILADEAVRRFCTVTLLRMEPDGDGVRVTSSCGGHPPPIVVRATGDVEVLSCQGTLLGLFEEVELRDATARLGPGDVLVLYTDGVTEAYVDDDELGGEGLEAILRSIGPAEPKQVADAIEAVAIGDPAVPRRRRDDVAIVVLRVEAEGAGAVTATA